MYHIKCKSFTSNQCNFEIQAADVEKIKINMKDHLENIHFSSRGKNLEIRAILQKVDNALMKTQKVISY